MDRAWWRQYADHTLTHFKGERVTINANVHGIQVIKFNHGKNSGVGAMSLAAHLGAERIILLGYDCQYGADGLRHWHGDHPKTLGNAVSMPKWYEQFRKMVAPLSRCEIINASRATALDFWPRQSLGEALEDSRH